MKAFVIGDLENNLTKKFMLEMCEYLMDSGVSIANGKFVEDWLRAGKGGKNITDLYFSLQSLDEADIIIPLTYERTPEIYFSIGYGIGKNKHIVPYWTSKLEKLRKYGFYQMVNDVCTTPDELVERVKSLQPKEERCRKIPEFSGKLNVYIAGDVRTKADQKKLFFREKAVDDLGHRGMNPPRLVDDVYSLEKHYDVKHVCDVPDETHRMFMESNDGRYKHGSKILHELLTDKELDEFLKAPGAERCFRTVDLCHVDWTEIYKPDNTGPWIEAGYAYALGMPVIGFNGYDWKKTFGGGIYDELAAYNERFGIPKEKWIAETKKDLKDVFDRLVDHYAGIYIEKEYQNKKPQIRERLADLFTNVYKAVFRPKPYEKIRLVEIIKSTDPKIILEMGAGNDNLYRDILKNSNVSRYIRSDVSENQLNQIKDKRIENMVYHGAKHPLEDGSIDTIFSKCVLHHIDNDNKEEREKNRVHFLKEQKRLINNNGRVFCIDVYAPYKNRLRGVLWHIIKHRLILGEEEHNFLTTNETIELFKKSRI